ncbi:MAG: hypothetical protein C6I05_07300 [Epsilonproteobacteria bacterium]|nr:hypothetical protein [Campylobacterota bacterium]
MKRFFKWLGYLLLFILFIALFLPKRQLYYKAEEELYRYGVVISDEQIEEGPFSLGLSNGDLYMKGILVGNFEEVDLYPDLLFNGVLVRGFRRNRSISLIPDLTIERLLLFYTPFYPLKLLIRGEGSFGTVEGWIDLRERKGEIDLFGEPKGLKNFLRLKKIEEGHYRYEFTL